MGNGVFGLAALALVAVFGFAWAARSFGGDRKRYSSDSSDGGYASGASAGLFAGWFGSSDRETSSDSDSSSDSSSSDSGGGGDGGGGGD